MLSRNVVYEDLLRVNDKQVTLDCLNRERPFSFDSYPAFEVLSVSQQEHMNQFSFGCESIYMP